MKSAVGALLAGMALVCSIVMGSAAALAEQARFSLTLTQDNTTYKGEMQWSFSSAINGSELQLDSHFPDSHPDNFPLSEHVLDDGGLHTVQVKGYEPPESGQENLLQVSEYGSLADIAALGKALASDPIPSFERAYKNGEGQRYRSAFLLLDEPVAMASAEVTNENGDKGGLRLVTLTMDDQTTVRLGYSGAGVLMQLSVVNSRQTLHYKRISELPALEAGDSSEGD